MEYLLTAEDIRVSALSAALSSLEERAALRYALVHTSALGGALPALADLDPTVSGVIVGRLFEAQARARGLLLEEMTARVRLAARASRDPRTKELVEAFVRANRAVAEAAVAKAASAMEPLVEAREARERELLMALGDSYRPPAAALGLE